MSPAVARKTARVQAGSKLARHPVNARRVVDDIVVDHENAPLAVIMGAFRADNGIMPSLFITSTA